MKPFFASLLLFFLFCRFSFSQERRIIEQTHPDGTPALVIFYNSNGEKNKEISYFLSGKIDYEGNYKDEQAHGKWIHYYEDGQKKFEENYKNGIEDGKQYEWEPDGQLTKIEVFKEGKLIKTIAGKNADE